MIWPVTTGLDARTLLQVPRVFEGGYGDGHGVSGVKVLAKGHQIQPVLTQGWTHWDAGRAPPADSLSLMVTATGHRVRISF